jgi:predicted SnoaL-like aldol condensation-catalyzing enzyme
MSNEENKRLVRRFWEEVFNGGDLGTADGLFSDQHELIHPYFSGDRRGAEPMKRFVAMSRKVSPDLRASIVDEVAEGDKVVNRWTAEGTLAERLCEANVGPGSVAATGVAIFRVSGGVIEETWLRLEPDVPDSELPEPKEEVRPWLLEGTRASDDVQSFGSADSDAMLREVAWPPEDDPTWLRVCCLWRDNCCLPPDPGNVE